MKKLLLIAIAGCLAFTGCDEDNEDKTKDIEKDGSVETVLDVQHLNDSSDVLTTEHRVWIKGSLYKTFQYHDTVPSLGTMIADGENKDGEETHVNVKRDYQFFITVK